MIKRQNIIISIVLGILVLISVVNIYNHSNSDNASEKFNKARAVSLSKSFYLNGRNFPEIALCDKSLDLKEYYNEMLVILLSNNGCNPCQKRELKLLSNIEKRGKIKVAGFYLGNNRAEMKLLKKVAEVNFPISDCFQGSFKSFTKEDKFPVILYVKNSVVCSSFYPIFEDDKFSEWYYNTIQK